MRLTLRTLIAFRDQVLPETQQNQLADRIQHIDFACQLLRRCENALPNSRISDELMLLDPNITANYLDSALGPTATQRFEEVALGDDNLLSEVAECHEVLAGYEEQLHGNVGEGFRNRLHAIRPSPPNQPGCVSPVAWSEFAVTTNAEDEQSWFTARNLMGPCMSAVVNGAMLIILSLLTVGAVHRVDPIELSIVEGKDEADVVVDLPENLEPELDSEDFSEVVAEPLDVPDESPMLDDHFFEESQSVLASMTPNLDASKFLTTLHSGSASNVVGGDLKSGRPSIKYYGKEYSAKDVVYIVDASGSMRGSRFRRACEELLYSLNNLEPSQRFAVIFFSGRNIRKYPGGRILAQASRTNIKNAQRLVRSTNPHGGTEPSASLTNALARKPELIFFLSDGEIPEDTVEVARRANEDYTVINTIGFEYRFGARLLRALAEQNGGEYRFVP